MSLTTYKNTSLTLERTKTQDDSIYLRALAVKGRRYYADFMSEDDVARLFAISLKHEAMAGALKLIHSQLDEFNHLDLKVLIETMMCDEISGLDSGTPKTGQDVQG